MVSWWSYVVVFPIAVEEVFVSQVPDWATSLGCVKKQTQISSYTQVRKASKQQSQGSYLRNITMIIYYKLNPKFKNFIIIGFQPRIGAEHSFYNKAFNT